METHKELVNYLINKGILRTEPIIEAFNNIDRVDFVLDRYLKLAYIDRPLPIKSQQTISQPTTVAFMLEKLQPKVGDNVLDIGSGSGWTTALLAHIVGERGKVTGVELKPDLVEFGRNNLKKYNFYNAEILKAGNNIGFPQNSPYDKILVSASAKEFPTLLLDQLDREGIMVLPVKNSIFKVVKNYNGEIQKEEYPGFVFVPLL